MKKLIYATCLLFSIGFLVVWYGVMGCQEARGDTPDAGAQDEIPRCMGPKDAGAVVYWRRTRYVCLDHGLERHGWWFEAQ